MRILRALPLLTLLTLAAPAVHAQQELMVSQYMFNGLFLNPAYAGSHNYISATMLHRTQWAKLEGAPKTSLLGIDGQFLGKKMGLGFTLSNDVIGVSRDTEMAVQYAYRIRMSDNSHLAFGLKAGMSLYSARLSDLIYWDSQDALYQQNISNAPVGKFGFGVYWHSDRSFIGLSVPTLYAADKKVAERLSGTEHYYDQHYYLNAGHVFEINESIDLKPSLLLKYERTAPPEVDLNCNVLYKERLWLGVGYRTGDAIVGMVEYQISPMLRAGYAYDMTTSELRRYSSGSHEVMLGFDLGKDPIKIKTPRYF